MYDMVVKWKSWEYDLERKSYDPSMTIYDIVAAQTDSKVDKTQFGTLVTSWFSEKTQEESENNKIVRSKSKDPHITGTKSFARLIHEETLNNNGIRPSRGTVYCMTRTRKNGRTVNEFAAEVNEKSENISFAAGGSSSVAGSFIDWTADDLAKLRDGKEEVEFGVWGRS